MKAIYKTILAAVAVTPLLTSCIEETFPTNGLVQGQLTGSSRATEALVMALPGHMNTVGTISTQHWDIGYPGLMICRDLMTADMVHSSLGANYDHFWYWGEIAGLGADYLYGQYPWNWYYKHILEANKVINAIDGDTEDSELRWQLASGYGWRAWTNLEMMRSYEMLPCDAYDYNPALVGLTVPIITETMTEEQMRNNPRVPHAEMVSFIKGDLDKGIALSEGAGAVPAGKIIPDLAVIYGLYARVCLWDASYQEQVAGDQAAAATAYQDAIKYADLAIATSGATPLTKDEWLNKSTGFNTPDFSSWMFCGQYVSEDTGVKAPNVSWVGWMATEKTYGYSSTRLKCFPEIGASVYNRISDRDWRKYTFVAPEGSIIADEVPFIDNELAENYFTQPYISVKFRPGSASTENGQVGAQVAYPLMRVEEMHFIKIEAQAHIDAAAGKAALESFMRTYRYPTYTCYETDKEEVVEEIVFQKRVELWGEGQSFYDIKRLNLSVTRAYEGTNFYGDMLRNTQGRPAWMNMIITGQEIDNNLGISRDQNNPSFEGVYPIITGY